MSDAGSTRTADHNGGATGTQAIGRTLAVLELFRQSDHDLGISEISHHLGLSGSTVHRMVRALLEAGYLAQNEATERYYLGRSAVLLGQAATQGLGLHRVQALLERLREQTGESVNLGARDGDDMVIVSCAPSKLPLRFSQEPGSRWPIYATAMGKAWLAHASSSIEEEVAALDQPLRSLAAKTITSTEVLTRELHRIRKRGFSLDDEESIPGVRCVAAPVLSKQGVLLACVAIQGPAVRMPRARLTSLAPVVRDAADDIALMLPASQRL